MGAGRGGVWKRAGEAACVAGLAKPCLSGFGVRDRIAAVAVGLALPDQVLIVFWLEHGVRVAARALIAGSFARAVLAGRIADDTHQRVLVHKVVAVAIQDACTHGCRSRGYDLEVGVFRVFRVAGSTPLSVQPVDARHAALVAEAARQHRRSWVDHVVPGCARGLALANLDIALRRLQVPVAGLCDLAARAV